MLKRREDGKLTLRHLDLEIFLADLFDVCKTEREVEWLQEQVQGYTENIADERINEIERGLL